MEDQGVWEIMEPSEESSEQSAEATAATKAKDRKARAHLLQCLPDDILMQVAAKKTGKEVWDSLKARFVGEERVREAWLQTLKSEFDAMKMKEEDTIDHYAGWLTGMSVRYGNLDGSLDDAALVKKMFDIVPERFINVVAGIEQFYDLKKLAFDEAVGRLKAYEERTRRGASGAAKTDTGQVLLTQAEWEARQKRMSGEGSGRSRSQERGGGSRGRGRGRGGNSSGRGGHSDAAKNGTGKRGKSHIKCFKCHKTGHYANKCPGEEKNKEEAHHARMVEFEPSVLMAETLVPGKPENTSSDKELSNDCQGKVFLNEVKVFPELHYTNDGVSYGDVWYLDNGASNHMTGDRAKFRDIDSTVSGKVTFGDGSTVDIHGRGSILFQGVSRDQWVLYDVYYIPKLKSNLVSLGQLTEIGHRVLMDDDLIESLRLLAEKEMAGGIPLIEHPDQVCQSCLVAKQTRCSFPQTSRWRADEPLELLHIDLCGPITPVKAGENEVWKWDTELGEGSEFTVEDAVGDTVQQYGGGGIGGDNQGSQPQNDSGGATDGVQGSGGVGNSVQPSEDAQPDIVTDQATYSDVSVNQHSGSEQENDDENMDIDHDDGPVRFRSLNEVYEDSVEVDLASDTEVEINAILATMEEPTCYQEAAGISSREFRERDNALYQL
ncbi:unnamed protein product [Miscanthus lutarioriparius]|uniref:CCHC-type domain-containing protein n=1 Tax=Miscanthus lutarioriparius TaxID=422564 RepID=A0A811QC22_9POAL|nr:unnamed protein product [Miscanthus lutarioriparius]